MKSQYDVIVVGAGPAGSTAARFAAMGGVSVLVLEKDREVGVPVRCAEGVSEAGLRQIVEPDDRWISNIVKGVFLYAPNGTRVCMENSSIGYVLNRKVFDYDLARMAADAGAEVVTKAYVFDLVKEDGCVRGVRMKHLGRELTVRGQIVVGADGVESRVGRWVGLHTHVGLHDIESCAQVTAAKVNVERDYCHFYFGHHIAPGGYAWVFPKGDGIANIGLGICGENSKNKPALKCLEGFLDSHFPQVSVLTSVAGGVPCALIPRRIVADGLMLVGDAARQANPVSGGGIVSGMIAAKIAGEVACQAIQKGDVSGATLQDYYVRWREAEGKTHERFYKIKEAILHLSDEDLNQTAETLLKIPVEKRTLLRLFTSALVNQPKLILIAAKVFV